jgi:hypothetical protein
MGEFWRLVAATVLGALISFGATFYFERRKEQRAEQAEEQRRRKELRRATRLVLDELRASLLLLERAVAGQQWWSNPPHDLEQYAWLEYRATLALEIEEEVEWGRIIAAYVEIGDLNRRLRIDRMRPAPIFEVDDRWVDVLDRVRYRVDGGVHALADMLNHNV